MTDRLIRRVINFLWTALSVVSQASRGIYPEQWRSKND